VKQTCGSGKSKEPDSLGLAEMEEVINMTDEVIGSYQQRDTNQPGSLRKAVETLRARLSSVRVETLVADGDTALSVRFLGDGANLQERQLLVSSLAAWLSPALSILGIKPEQKQGSEEVTRSNNAS